MPARPGEGSVAKPVNVPFHTPTSCTARSVPGVDAAALFARDDFVPKRAQGRTHRTTLRSPPVRFVRESSAVGAGLGGRATADGGVRTTTPESSGRTSTAGEHEAVLGR